MAKHPSPQHLDRVIAVDPGEKTGIAIWECSAQVLSAQVLSVSDTVEFFLGQLAKGTEDVWVVVEKFTITAQTGKMSTLGLNWPLELTGVARAVAQHNDWAFDNSQGPAAAKRFSPDERLKAAGWWDKLRAAETGPEDHARDAARHLLLALCESKLMDVPRIGG